MIPIMILMMILKMVLRMILTRPASQVCVEIGSENMVTFRVQWLFLRLAQRNVGRVARTNVFLRSHVSADDG